MNIYLHILYHCRHYYHYLYPLAGKSQSLYVFLFEWSRLSVRRCIIIILIIFIITPSYSTSQSSKCSRVMLLEYFGETNFPREKCKGKSNWSFHMILIIVIVLITIIFFILIIIFIIFIIIIIIIIIIIFFILIIIFIIIIMLLNLRHMR